MSTPGTSLASIIQRFGAEFIAQYRDRLLPSQLGALNAMQACRSSLSRQMLAQCGDCGAQRLVPHSCGHRSCPHCQHFESQRWIERQTQALLPGAYFLITFTLPQELRGLAWAHQKSVYTLLMQCAWETLAEFAAQHRQLKGSAGAVGVLHTHSRRLEFHPHVHLAMPAAALDAKQGLWRSLRKTRSGGHYLFSHKALAAVFRAKLLAALQHAGLSVPVGLPERWVVDCKHVGNGAKALVYLGRYLYRGVIQERDILRSVDGQVTFRYRDSATGKNTCRTVSGAQFLWLVLQHVLPRGFRRSRNFGLLHGNCKHRQRLSLLRLGMRQPSSDAGAGASASGAPALAQATATATAAAAAVPTPERPQLRCHCCGGVMKIVLRRLRPLPPWAQPRGPDGPDKRAGPKPSGAEREGPMRRATN